MSECVAVTSFSPAGWTDYAEEGVRSFCENWPGRVIAYYEKDKPAFTHEKLTYRNLFDQTELLSVLSWCERNPVLQGRMPNGKYNYNFNIYKFCRHVFAVSHAAVGKDGRYVFWLDADVRIKKPVPEEFLSLLFEGDAYTVRLYRGPASHTESGFQGFDTSMEINSAFMNIWRELYIEGTVIALPYGFHDCWSYDHMVKFTRVRAANLTPQLTAIGPAFKHSSLDEYMTHEKGINKYMDKLIVPKKGEADMPEVIHA